MHKFQRKSRLTPSKIGLGASDRKRFGVKGVIPELLAEVCFTLGIAHYEDTPWCAITFRSARRCRGDGARTWESGHKSLLAIAAKAVEVDDGDAAIFKLQETFFLQPLQALIGVLPGDA